MLTKCCIQLKPVFIVGLDAVDWSMLVEQKGNSTLDFVYVFKIIYTEILSQAIAQRFIKLFVGLLTNSQNGDAFIG